MKKFTNKQIEEFLNDFVNIDNKEYVKGKCFEKIFYTKMSVKRYSEFIKKTFEFDVSVSTVKEWKKEFDELQNKHQAPTQNENEISHGYPDKSIEQ
jgi:hypothetical protein